ncbi:hypothetical protein [uncultured Ruminococcus sp.]|uniref:hypothetical protein n=1 Tax=uncultured Ruminococcus sp. TaxID=165186 RepID=UPI0029317607|nr:hypothetical protein [uncultured Ruminococcus sp.]
MALYRISDLNVEIKTNSPTLADSIRRYAVTYQADPNVVLEMSDDRLIEMMEENEGVTSDVIENMYIATLFSWALFDFNGFPMRAVGVEHDGVCTLFAAPDDSSVDLNDVIPEELAFVYDYPGIRMQDDDYFVFDTPFGKNGFRSKTGRKLKLSSIVFVDSKRFDSLRKIEAKDFVPLFMHAVSENCRQERTKHTLFILERVMHRVDFYGVRDVNDLDFILERI